MEVYSILTVIQGERSAASRRTGPKANGDRVAKSRSSPGDVVEIISLENRRAAMEAPRSLAEAKICLEAVKSELSRMNRTEVKKLHRLEGLVHVFPT